MKMLRSFFSPFSHRIYIATGILLFALLYLNEINSLKNAQDKLLVNPVIWIIIIIYPIIIWQEWREFKKKKAEKETEHSVEDEDTEETSVKLTKKIFFFMLSTFGYLILMNYFGFIIMTLLYMPLLMWILGTKSKKILIILPIITAICLFVLFDIILGIPLPEGLFLEGVF